MVLEKLRKTRIIPVIALESPEDAVPLGRALHRGGLEVAEITFRTKAAEECLRILANEFPDFALGAGTITTTEELEQAVNAGAEFGVSPGLNSKVVERAQELGLSFFPGVCTPTDIEMALERGCRVLKYFPAGAMGGVKMLKALYGPFSHKGVLFIPTGGVKEDNLVDYLSEPCVLAVGGTWIVPKSLIENKNWTGIENLAKQAMEIVDTVGK